MAYVVSVTERIPGMLLKWWKATCSSTTSLRGRWWRPLDWTSPTSPSTSTKEPPWRTRRGGRCIPGTSRSSARSANVSRTTTPGVKRLNRGEINSPVFQNSPTPNMACPLWRSAEMTAGRAGGTGSSGVRHPCRSCSTPMKDRRILARRRGRV